MAIWIQKITKTKHQYRVTLPKDLVKLTGLDKARVVEITKMDKGVIKIREYHARKPKGSRI